MATAITASAPRLKTASSFRFTLGGMFIMVLGLAVGLAYGRLPGVDFSIAILASLATWLACGLFQRSRLLLRQLLEPQDVTSGKSRAQAVELSISIGSLIALTIAAVLDLAARTRWSYFEPIHPEYWYATALLTTAIIYLLMICIYWLPPRLNPRQPSRASLIWKGCIDGLAILAGLCVLAAILMEQGITRGFVYLAIRGVENFAPFQWNGQPFARRTVPSLEPTHEFIEYGQFAAALFAAATVAIVVLIRRPQMGRRLTFTCGIVSAGCLVAVVGLLAWCRNDIFPQMSTCMASVIGDPFPGSIVLLPLFVLIAAGALAFQLVASPESSVASGVENDAVGAAAHLHPAMVAVCFVGILAGILFNAWQLAYGDLTQPGITPQIEWLVMPTFWWAVFHHVLYWLEAYEPIRLLRLALAMVLARRLWRMWKGDLATLKPRWIIEPRRFAFAWAGSTVLLSLVGPVGAWWAAALTFKYYFGM